MANKDDYFFTYTTKPAAEVRAIPSAGCSDSARRRYTCHPQELHLTDYVKHLSLLVDADAACWFPQSHGSSM